MSRHSCITALVTVVFVLGLASAASAATDKPNILVNRGDDIGQLNVSAYNNGGMGYRTPNIDSIANAGAMFTAWHGPDEGRPADGSVAALRCDNAKVTFLQQNALGFQRWWIDRMFLPVKSPAASTSTA